ncbi:MAG TPA: hypothetical protein VN642_03800 [Dongiaceae bacterium]|nr:hypothetical protein [Dongiaceae bacterium]
MKATVFGTIVVTLCTMLGTVSPRITDAATYVPHTVTEQTRVDITLFKRPGTTVHLFYGAMPETVQSLAGKEFSVFRESAGCPADKLKVGRIRLTKSAGDHHLEAVVIEGELKEGDIGQLGTIYGLVVLTGERCETLSHPDEEPVKGH